VSPPPPPVISIVGTVGSFELPGRIDTPPPPGSLPDSPGRTLLDISSFVQDISLGNLAARPLVTRSTITAVPASRFHWLCLRFQYYIK